MSSSVSAPSAPISVEAIAFDLLSALNNSVPAGAPPPLVNAPDLTQLPALLGLAGP